MSLIMNTLRKLRNIALIILASLSVQGCLRSFLKELDDLRESIDRLALVPTYLPRFHVNGIEYYRGEDRGLWAGKYPSFIVSRNIYGSTTPFYAVIQAVNPDGTASSSRGYFRFSAPKDLVYEGSSVRTDDADLRLPDYPYDIVIESLELSFPKFQGFNQKDTVWIDFSFEGSAYEDYLPEGSTKKERRFVEKVFCTDGKFREIIQEER